MYKKFNFASQLSVGNSGEADFQKYYADLLPVKSTEDLRYDFLLGDGKTLELKSDSYNEELTENFFMETISDTKSGKLGGVFRSKQDEIDYFVYYFVKSKSFYWFNVTELYEKLNDYILVNNPKVKSIKNRNWITEGFAVPRSVFDGILIKKDKF